jgi:hypothetical protein
LVAELLLAGNQNDLAAEAMKELGNLHFHVGDKRFFVHSAFIFISF